MNRYSANRNNRPWRWIATPCLLILCICLVSGCSEHDSQAASARQDIASEEKPVPPTPTAQSEWPIHGKSADEKADGGSDDQHHNQYVTEWYPRNERDVLDLNFNMTNQDGEAVNLARLVDRPTAISFIFTRCGNQKMCPLITVTLANLQRDLEAAGLRDKTRVILVSYDPVYDTPELLKKYGEDRGFRFDQGGMLRPEVDTYRDFITELNLTVGPMPDGTFNHAMELLLLDHQGHYAREYHGVIWANAPVVEDLRKLVDEQTAAGK